MAISLIGLSRPADYQIGSGTILQVWLTDEAHELDLHVVQAVYRGNSQISAPQGWELVHQVRTGTTVADVVQDIWLYPVHEGQTSPETASFVFSSEEGEKWVGVHTLRGVDLSDPVGDVAGTTVGDEEAI